MAVTPATLIPLYVQRIRECLKIKDKSIRDNTWKTLAEPVSVLLELSEDSDLLDSVFSKEELGVFQKLVESHTHKSIVRHPAARSKPAKLSEYPSVATLPSMPWNPRLQGSTTVKRPTNQRNLRSVQQIPTWRFFGRILSYQEARPASDTNNFPRKEHVVSWVHQVALQTAACLLHNTEPGSKDWNFGKATSKQGLSDVVFKSVSRTKDAQPEVNRLLVEVKCPWTLPLSEMEEITKLHNGLPAQLEAEAGCDKRELSSGKPKKPGYTPAQRVLAQVYDYCREQKHHFFIITTYEYWMFGVFLQDYTVAAVTKPVPYDHKGPTIIQCITYWLQSSLFLPGSFEIPEDSMVLNSPVPIDRYTTERLWTRALRGWREKAIQELSSLSKHAEAKKLVGMCRTSLEKLGTSPSSPASRETHLLARCRRVVDQIQPRPTSPCEWIVILTWLAVMMDPITFGEGLESLEEAFVVAADWDPNHPITEDKAHRKRKSFVDSRRARGKPARLLQPNDSFNDGTMRGFYWRYASKEVALILDQYLPTEIRLQLQRWNDRATLTSGPQNCLQPRDLNLEPQKLAPRRPKLAPGVPKINPFVFANLKLRGNETPQVANHYRS
ncbi:hypothetical protein FRC01_002018 [Tulasnella sp. 417]|nr:hypothetical protein FRC01_002018 [Tulasnella sp. 417]